MANKRTLKKTINYICSDLFAECVAASLYSGKPDQEDVNALLASILSIHSDFIRRISHPEPGMKDKEYFQELMKDFNKQVSEIIDQIGNLH
jgi:predicted naringenin-chalcone synthase